MNSVRIFKGSVEQRSVEQGSEDSVPSSTKTSDIDTSSPQLGHFLYKIHKNHERLFQEHRHLRLEVNNNWENVRVV